MRAKLANLLGAAAGTVIALSIIFLYQWYIKNPKPTSPPKLTASDPLHLKDSHYCEIKAGDNNSLIIEAHDGRVSEDGALFDGYLLFESISIGETKDDPSKNKKPGKIFVVNERSKAVMSDIIDPAIRQDLSHHSPAWDCLLDPQRVNAEMNDGAKVRRMNYFGYLEGNTPSLSHISKTSPPPSP